MSLAAASASSPALHHLGLVEIFSNLHAEFSLPRCPQGEIPVPADLAGHPLAANPLKLFTATQEMLATVTATYAALTGIASLFARHTTASNPPEYACAFAIVLVQADALRRLVAGNEGLQQSLVALSTEKENAGYRRLLATCCPACA